MIKKLFLLFLIGVIGGGIFLYRSIFVVGINTVNPEFSGKKGVMLEIKSGMTYADVIADLKAKGFTVPVTMSWYAKYTGIDQNLKTGQYSIDLISKVTVKDFFTLLSKEVKTEQSITILPGWDLRDVANYLVKQKIAQSVDEVYALLGKPAEYAIPSISPTKTAWIAGKPSRVSLEGYLAPDTFSVYNTATLPEVVDILLQHRRAQLEPLLPEIAKSGRSLHEIMTMAALLEREVRTPKDKAIVADIFWKRHDVNMGLQADSTVHYATGKEGSVFTSKADRASTNPWNTYKYPGLPPGPIALPSIASIEAALRSTKNDYWYFLTTLDTGEVKYGKTLAEHNANVQKYLRK